MNLEKLINHQIWADKKIRDIIRELNDEEFNRAVSASFGSVKEICLHLAVGVVYTLRVFFKKEKANVEKLQGSMKKMSKDEILTIWKDADREFLDTAKTAPDEMIFPNFKNGNELRIASDDVYISHIAHSTYHRGQIMSMLKALGKDGVTTDYFLYLLELERKEN